MTAISRSNIGSIHKLYIGGNFDHPIWEIYGPDPWSYSPLGSFMCWFSATEYKKEYGDYPDYVSDSDKQLLGL